MVSNSTTNAGTAQSSENSQTKKKSQEEIKSTDGLEKIQSDEQRSILDIVAYVRKCGLDTILSLPQLVVCGDQSSGKSSVLEALTEISFPTNDNLCTRHATEIILRRGPVQKLTIRVNPATSRSVTEATAIRAFSKTISDFGELPKVMDAAMVVMGIKSSTADSTSASTSQSRAFARDVLSVEMEGPNQPQLTLVDIPGLIQSSTKGTTDADVQLVADITDFYIEQQRTICLAVISSTNDIANQPILRKVRKIDPQGERTLGIITKPDKLSAGSGSEKEFIELARNENIQLKLGWHVLKNRSYEEKDCSLLERNMSEEIFFQKSNFKELGHNSLGIETLRERLSVLLGQHVKRELPQLQKDLETALEAHKSQLSQMGNRRASLPECKAYLTQLSLDYYEICKAAVNGHYEGSYFQNELDSKFTITSPATIRRTRAAVQWLNTSFAETMRVRGQKYIISKDESSPEPLSTPQEQIQWAGKPLTNVRALAWVKDALIRTRGKELIGNYNPLLIGELFWEQSSKWESIAKSHVKTTSHLCSQFSKDLLLEKCPRDVEAKLWPRIQEKLKQRHAAALEELGKVMEDFQSHPINYNHYYTDTITKAREDRQKALLAKAIEDGTTEKTYTENFTNKPIITKSLNIPQITSRFNEGSNPNMEEFSCREALDCLHAIYKVQLKNFVAIVTMQVIERHIVRGLGDIFSPVLVSCLSDAEVKAIASEPESAQQRREFLEGRIAKLEDGYEVFKGAMAGI